MKRFLLLPIILLILLSTQISANTPGITGQWLLTKVKLETSTEVLYQEFNFRADGNTELQGIVFGSWKTDNNNHVIIKSEMIKEFANIWTIASFDSEELVLKSQKATLFFTKYNKQNIAKGNRASDLTGVWEFKNTNNKDGKYFIHFQEPDNLLIKYVDYGYTSTAGGSWIYKSKDNSVVMITDDYLLRGLNRIVSISDTSLTLKSGKTILTGKKLEQNGEKRVRLNSDTRFCNPDSNTEQINYENFSWFDFEARTSYLKNISKLKYKKSILMDKFDAFTTENISANVNWNNNSIVTDKIFDNLPTGKYTDNNIFYPLEEPFIYYTIGKEEITVPAGTFMCRVIDTDSFSYGNKTRLYLIENRPGVYAKIINIEDTYDSELYTMYELESIEGNFEYQSNNQIIGKWFLTEIRTGDKIKKTSTNFEFINDGRMAISQNGSTGFYTWKKSGNGITLNFGNGAQNFKISELSSTKLKLENSETGYSFIKMNTTTNSTADSMLTAYWMLINTSDPYSLIYLTKDHSVFDIDRISKSPISENYSDMVGKWMYDSAGKNIVFNTNEYEALCSGSLKVKKLNSEVLVLNNQGYQLVFIKIDPDKNIKNNNESGLMGLWKIENQNGKINYYDFRDPELFRKGSSEGSMPKRGLWFYNPENKKLFLGYMMHQMEGFSVISGITENEIKFENGLKAERVR